MSNIGRVGGPVPSPSHTGDVSTAENAKIPTPHSQPGIRPDASDVPRPDVPRPRVRTPTWQRNRTTQRTRHRPDTQTRCPSQPELPRGPTWQRNCATQRALTQPTPTGLPGRQPQRTTQRPLTDHMRSPEQTSVLTVDGSPLAQPTARARASVPISAPPAGPLTRPRPDDPSNDSVSGQPAARRHGEPNCGSVNARPAVRRRSQRATDRAARPGAARCRGGPSQPARVPSWHRNRAT